MVRSIVRWILDFTEQHRAIRTVVLTLIYTSTLALCFWAAYQIRFDFDVPPNFQAFFLFGTLATISAKLVVLFAFHQFDGRLIYFGMPDLKRLVVACTAGSITFAAMSIVPVFVFAPPRGVVLIDFVLCVLALSAVRLGFWRVRAFAFLGCQTPRSKPCRVGIVGAGNAGALLARHLMDNRSLELQPVAFFDDVCGRSASVHGIAVVGTPERIAEFKVKLRIEQLIIAMPSAPAKRVKQVMRLALAAGLECKTVPSLSQLATGRVSITTLRPVRIEDLLGRVPVRIKTEAVRDLLKGGTVMVTGAGGSIGSELCRQILSFKPTTLLLVERSEPVLFAIEQELLHIPQWHFNRAACRRRHQCRAHGAPFSIGSGREVIFHCGGAQARADDGAPAFRGNPEQCARNRSSSLKWRLGMAPNASSLSPPTKPSTRAV